ncbi:hypothetical protein RRG08_022645 [Elysia crispata]|uniref:Uncharacterized protein n=1 Tax=Elysia crispata TaxID=231223 RepID=A0AAE0Z270_9GAST|nr:hypothetical protein RRG08_022645 [Elysia crispata]
MECRMGDNDKQSRVRALFDLEESLIALRRLVENFARSMQPQGMEGGGHAKTRTRRAVSPELSATPILGRKRQRSHQRSPQRSHYHFWSWGGKDKDHIKDLLKDHITISGLGEEKAKITSKITLTVLILGRKRSPQRSHYHFWSWGGKDKDHIKDQINSSDPGEEKTKISSKITLTVLILGRKRQRSPQRSH